jgi:GNAT superfamily N-acetyltransferase
MGLEICRWGPEDLPFLWEMLLQSIHVPEGALAPPRSILAEPAIARYLDGFGDRVGDDAVVAWECGSAVGAAFCRRFPVEGPGYGFVSMDIPEVGMAVVASHRDRGIGRALLTTLLERYPTMSLSVDIGNARAHNLYTSLGFTTVKIEGSSATMLRECPKPTV